MVDILVGLVIIAIVAGAITKIVIEKRKGVKCVGCPYSGANGKATSSCGCNAK